MTKLSAPRLLTAAILSLGAIGAPASTAASLGTLAPLGQLQGPASPCSDRVLSQPFAAWNDTAFYFLVPGGTFETGASGWSLSGGASVTSGGNSFLSSGSALALPAGASAVTPSVCVDVASPTLRGFVNSSQGTVAVSVIVAGIGVPVGVVLPRGSWQPTPVMLFLTNTLGLVSASGTTAVSFRFTAVGGSARLDDIYIDPYRRT